MKKLALLFMAIFIIAFIIKDTPLFSAKSTHPDVQFFKEQLLTTDFTKPKTVIKYGKKNPAGKEPLLVWHTVPRAVYYELEFTTELPNNPNGVELSANSLFHTQSIYTNGYYADLREYNYSKLYWRVRALDYDGNPIGVFSDAEPIYISKKVKTIPKPIINTLDDIDGLPLPLYPVYKWIPLHDITTAYEVELLSQPPEFENGTQPSKYRIWSKIADDSSDCYDDFARLLTPGTYYWRVRAVDSSGNTIGTYSDTASFIITKPASRVFAATYGDSITHGGGAISYSPANLEYNYQTYLDFPALNLGKSGDTSTTTAERFDSDVLPFRPKNLLILCGANSLRAGTPASTIMRDLIDIRTKCFSNNIRPIFLTLLPLNPDNIYRAFNTETADNWQDELAKVNAFIRKQPYMIDLEPYFYDDDGFLATKYATDGLHPDIEGKILMAKIINAHKNLLAK